jgi:hypothetical protein
MLYYFWLLSLTLNSVSIYIINKRGKLLISEQSPLPDIILDNLTSISKIVLPCNEFIPDIFLIINLLYIYYTNFLLINHCLVVHTCAMTMRSLTVLLTTYPASKEKKNKYHTNYDLMFSGHVATLFSLAVDPISYILAILGSFSVLAAHQHYSADVAVSILITELIKTNMYIVLI